MSVGRTESATPWAHKFLRRSNEFGLVVQHCPPHMLHTFENNERQQLRRQERERHLSTMNRIAQQAENRVDFVEPPVVDTMSEDGLMHQSDQNNDSPSRVFHDQSSRRPTRMGLRAGVLVALVVAVLAVTLFQTKQSRLVGGPNVVQNDEAYNRLVRLILDWKITSRDVLENATSAPARALAWLATPDGGGRTLTNLESVRTRYSLATVYYSTEEESWKNQQHWLSSFPVCLWWGVECVPSDTETQLVQALNLSMNGLEGALPLELSLLQGDLASLDVSHNELTGSLPDLGTLRNLQRLYVGPNPALSASTIPSWLYSLSHLKQVYINECNLQGSLASEIGQLSQLQGLALYRNHITGTLPTQLGALTDLRVLYLDDNNLQGRLPAHLSDRLVDLRLQHNYLTGSIPTEWSRLQLLQLLYLDNNQLTGSPQVLSELSLLHQLHLHRNQLTGRIPDDWSILLSVLYLDGNQLTGSIPAQLGRLRYLQSLYLFDNDLTGSFPTELGMLDSLETLRVDHNHLTGGLPSELGLLDKLSTFYAHNNSLAGSVEPLTGMDRLERVRLHGNDFVGSLDLCQQESWTELTADCHAQDLSCECCTMCFDNPRRL